MCTCRSIALYHRCANQMNKHLTFSLLLHFKVTSGKFQHNLSLVYLEWPLYPHQNGQGWNGPCFFQRLNALKCLKCQEFKKIASPPCQWTQFLPHKISLSLILWFFYSLTIPHMLILPPPPTTSQTRELLKSYSTTANCVKKCFFQIQPPIGGVISLQRNIRQTK